MELRGLDNVRRPAAGRVKRPVLNDQGLAFPFWGLMFFTFVLFIGPQFVFPSLRPLRLAAVSGGLALCVYLFDRGVRGRPLTVGGPVVRLMLGLFGLAVLSIPLSRWPGGSTDALVDGLGKSLVVFFLVANTVTTVRRMKLIMWSLALWSIFLSVAGVRDFATGNLELEGIRIAGYDAPLSANPNDLAVCLNLILALMVGLHGATVRLPSRLLLLAGIGVAVAGVVVSFSRGGFLTLLVIGLTLSWRWVREGRLSGVALLLVILVLGMAALPAGYGHRLYSIFDTSADATGSAEARWGGMVAALKLMLEHPILGLGLNMHGLALVDAGLGWTMAHNAFLQVGADLGVLAFILYILLVWRVWRGVREVQDRLKGLPNTRSLRMLGFGIELAVVAYVVEATVGPIAYNFYFFYLAGFMVAFQQIARQAVAEADGLNAEFPGVIPRQAPYAPHRSPHPSHPARLA